MFRKIEIGDRVICSDSGGIGKVLEFYTPTSCEEQTLVKTDVDGEYHAPTRTLSKTIKGTKPSMVILDECVFNSLGCPENIIYGESKI